MNELWFYILDNCECQYIKHERAYSAYMTFMGYDYQEYELDAESAKRKLATKLSNMKGAREWFETKKK